LPLNLRPVNSSLDLMRLVPGLFIAQHMGGGKAEQLFIRGFEIGLSIENLFNTKWNEFEAEEINRLKGEVALVDR
jgi:ubiquinone biosynthesis protein Coq4